MSDKKSAFDYFIEIIGWLRIVSSPLAIALVIAGFVYFPNPGNMRLIIAIVIVIVGLVIGIIWATNVWRKTGTNRYLTTIRSTADLDTFTADKEDRRK